MVLGLASLGHPSGLETGTPGTYRRSVDATGGLVIVGAPVITRTEAPQ
jgi:hypothetical protein